MGLNDKQSTELLSQRVIQFEAEKASHNANLVSLGALRFAFEGTPEEQGYIVQIAEAKNAILRLDLAIDALKNIIGKPGSSANLQKAADEAVTYAEERRVVIEEAAATAEILEGE